MASIEGDWSATKENCGCGYSAVWKVTVVDASSGEGVWEKEELAVVRLRGGAPAT